MSYHLVFWKEKPDAKLAPKHVDAELNAGKVIEGLEDLPTEHILDRIRSAHSTGWTQLDPFTWEASKKSFQVFIKPQFFLVTCGGLTGEEMNVFIDIGIEFGCALYDPQTEVRCET
jgi:hypothetical protein